MDSVRALLSIGTNGQVLAHVPPAQPLASTASAAATPTMTLVPIAPELNRCKTVSDICPSDRAGREGATTNGSLKSGDKMDGDVYDTDPGGEGTGESAWGKGKGLAVIETLGSWCGSISAYDRLARPAPGSAVCRAAAAESEWEELEKCIARRRLNVEAEEFR